MACNRLFSRSLTLTHRKGFYGIQKRQFHLWGKLPGDDAPPSTYRPIIIPPSSSKEKYDVAIVGGGIVGLATAREILRNYPSKTVVVLEKEGVIAPHQSSHNSGVIHAGIYYKPGSTIARTCVRGAELMYQYCAEKGLPVERCGKIIVAVNEKEHELVEGLYEKATKNGVQGLKIIYGKEISEMEPNIVGYSALHSPNTGIVDYAQVANSMAKDIIDTGNGDITLRFHARKFERTEDGSIRISGCEPTMDGPMRTVQARHVITCAGFYSDRVAALAGGNFGLAKVVTFRGSYLQFKPQYRTAVRMNVYPVPSQGGIPVGIHYTPTLNSLRGRQVIVGPGACLTFSREGYRFFDLKIRDIWDVVTNRNFWAFALKNVRLSLGELYMDLNKRAFFNEAKKMMPTVREEMIEPSFAGVMSQVFNDTGAAESEYVLERKQMGGSVLNVRNAPSPAATASLAIAEMVVSTAAADFAWEAKNPSPSKSPAEK